MKNIYVVRREMLTYSDYMEDYQSTKNLAAFNTKESAIKFINEQIDGEINKINNDSEYELKTEKYVDLKYDVYSYVRFHKGLNETQEITFRIDELNLYEE